MGVVVSPLLVLGCGTVCCNNFDGLTFRLTVLRQYIEDVLVQVTGIAALCD
jgi:G3E family GTPase